MIFHNLVVVSSPFTPRLLPFGMSHASSSWSAAHKLEEAAPTHFWAQQQTSALLQRPSRFPRMGHIQLNVQYSFLTCCIFVNSSKNISIFVLPVSKMARITLTQYAYKEHQGWQKWHIGTSHESQVNQ